MNIDAKSVLWLVNFLNFSKDVDFGEFLLNLSYFVTGLQLPTILI